MSAAILRVCVRPSMQILHGQRLSLMKHSSTCTKSGGILSKPEKTSFGLLKVTCMVVPFLYLGGMISREGAAWLEENDIFSPEDDD